MTQALCLNMQEFGNGTNADEGKSFAAALDEAEGGETVVRISGAATSQPKETNGTSGGASGLPADPPAAETGMEEQQVDRIIDSHDNEFVLSRAGSEMQLVLTLDPRVRMHPHAHACMQSAAHRGPCTSATFSHLPPARCTSGTISMHACSGLGLRVSAARSSPKT